jgi:hypothetical protein
VSLVELVRKDLFLFSAADTLANERFEILKRFVSWAMLWCCSHDKSPPPTSKSDLPHAIALGLHPIVSVWKFSHPSAKSPGKRP